jgi:hypothetical protein
MLLQCLRGGLQVSLVQGMKDVPAAVECFAVVARSLS